MHEKKIEKAVQLVKEMGADGWLLYDFRKSNELAHQFLEIGPKVHTTRRFFYWVPVLGPPVKIVHAIESQRLNCWPGEERIYLSWQSLEEHLRHVLKGCKKIAMEYSPKNEIPPVSRVDGGTIDFIRSCGVEVLSSASFLPQFTAVLTKDQRESHVRAAKALGEIIEGIWAWTGASIKENRTLTERQIQERILAEFQRRGLVCDGDPIVAMNAHSADPHFATEKEGSAHLKRGDFILIDFWAKEPQGIFADFTYVAVAAEKPSERQREIFTIVHRAQKAAIDLIVDRFRRKQLVLGWEADEAARGQIRAAGYEKYFIHRTGHNIGVELHGSGANLDNLEMHDTRPILAGTCFSVEPGIYLPGEFGVRLECDVLIDPNDQIQISGHTEKEIRCLI